ncbi:MAG: radical SAM protein [Deltaproteobacteria bacterium]|nr:radical SAM protein [Deltaproteobacteria bacterium]
MRIAIQEKKVKSILSKSGIPGVDYCINPYTGCAHGCRYCYATFMKRYTGHTEEWGSFVDVKVNAPEVLQRQIKRATGHVILSSVTDPYQPLEEKYGLTRKCLEILLPRQISVGILTKSPLVLRDIEVIRKFEQIEVGLTITTDDEEMRKTFEPGASPISARIQALKTLHENGIRTYAFIGPILPLQPEAFAKKIYPYVQRVLIDRMNYVFQTRKMFERMNLGKWLDDDYVDDIIYRLKTGLAGKDICIC